MYSQNWYFFKIVISNVIVNEKFLSAAALGKILTDRNPPTLFFTFLGEKILGIFAGHYEFAWDTPQQLNDQRYMVYAADNCKRRGGEEDRQDKQQIHQTVSQSQAHSGCVGGGLRNRGVGLTAHNNWVGLLRLASTDLPLDQTRPSDMMRAVRFLNFL